MTILTPEQARTRRQSAREEFLAAIKARAFAASLRAEQASEQAVRAERDVTMALASADRWWGR